MLNYRESKGPRSPHIAFIVFETALGLKFRGFAGLAGGKRGEMGMEILGNPFKA